MKIPCVRCGKKIDSPHVYCRDCSRELEGEANGLAAPKKRRIWPVLLLLLLIAGGGAWGYFSLSGDTLDQKLVSLSEEVPTVEIIAEKLPDELTPEALAPPREPETPPESARPEQPSQEEDVVLFTSDETPAQQPEAAEEEQQNAGPDLAETPDASLDAAEPDLADTTDPADPAETDDMLAQADATDTAPDQDSAAESPADQVENDTAAAEANEAAEATEATGSEEPAESEPDGPDGEGGEEVASQDEAAAEQTAQEPEAAQESSQPEPSQPEPVEDGVWVFWMDTEGTDKQVAERLQKEGFVNSKAKGQWPGHFNDKNIFYRHEDKRGLERLEQALDDDEFYTYYFNNERIGHNVKQIFYEHDNVQFVIISQ